MVSFPDVPAGHWAAGFIDAVTDLGWMHGYPDGTFQPERPVERDELAAVLWEVAFDMGLIAPPVVPDTTPPVITLLGAATMTVVQGQPWTDPGWTVTDDTDPDPVVVVVGEPDTATAGVYTVTYNAADVSGNTSSVIRTVVVEAFNPPPVDDYDTILQPGDDYQAKVDQAGEGSLIGVTGGTFDGFSVQMRHGQTLVALPDERPILDGQGASVAIQGHSIDSVVIDGGTERFLIRNYATPMYHGAICFLTAGDWYNNPRWGTAGVKCRNVEITNSFYGFTASDDHAELTDFHFHHLGNIGFKMLFGHHQLVARGEINNITPSNWGHEGGGSKSWETRNLVHEDIHVHDLVGPGLWTDHGNLDTIYRRIHARNTTAAGIFHEISGWCDIDDCLIEDQPPSGGDSIWSRGGAGITIANAKARITATLLRNMETGIAYLDQSRGGWTDTTEGSVDNVTLDAAGKSGSGNDHGGPQPAVSWTNNVLLNGSTIN